MKTNLIQGNYQVFVGPYATQMPILVNQELTPLTTKDIMDYRIKAIQSKNKDEIDFWLNQYWDTVDGLAHFKGDLIIVQNSQELLNINKYSKLEQGSLVLTQEQYDKLAKEKDVLKRNKVISNRGLTKKQAKTHPIWLRLAQEDKALLNEYVDAIFSKAKRVYKCDKNMGIHLPDDQEIPVMNNWGHRDLDCGVLDYGASFAYTWEHLNYYWVHLIGMRAKNLEELLETKGKK